MPSSTSSFEIGPSLCERERRWLLRYGAWFAVFGFPVGFLVGGALWYIITLDRALLPEQWSGWFGPKGLLLGVLVASVPWVWFAGIWLEERWGAIWRRWGVAPLLTLLLSLGAEAGFRTVRAQDWFWQAVRARAGDAYFTREVSLFRLDVASSRAATSRPPGVVVVGSSQMLHALDGPELSRRIGKPVVRRAVAGMFPIEMCAWQDFIETEAGGTLLMMLSGLDLGARGSLLENAIRPLATRGGMRDLLLVADRERMRADWRPLVELVLASGLDLWRSRDFFQWILRHPGSPYRTPPRTVSEDAVIGEQRRAYGGLGSNEAIVDYARDCLRVFLMRMLERFDRILILEGQVSPRYAPERWATLSGMLANLLQEFEDDERVVFVPVEAQAAKVTEAMWSDMIHVNTEGRKAYTEIFTAALVEKE